MKKTLLLIAAAVAFVACSTEETVRVQDPAQISFEASWVENATRADVAADPSTTTASLSAFDVWGFMDAPEAKVFEDEDVTGTKGNFTYLNTQYWVPGHTYYFAALAPMNSANWDLDTTNANTYGAGVVSFTNVDGSEDLLYAATAVEAPALGDSKTVMFTFSHLLSKVKFTFTNGFDNEFMTFDVKNIRIVDAPAAGTIDLAVENWWDNDDWQLGTESVELNFGDACEQLAIGAKQQSADERLTIPAGADRVYTVKFDLTLYANGVQVYPLTTEGTFVTKEVKIENVALQMGKAYNFKAELNAKNFSEDGTEFAPIVFDVEEVKDWVTAETPDAQVEEAELRAALLLGGNVTLTKDVELTKPLVVAAGTTSTINLNGFNIINTNKTLEYGQGEGIVVYGDLTINGEGTVKGSTRAVWARGADNATVTINGGNYEGCEAGYAEGGNSVIYASSGNTINIYGGTFTALAEDTVSYANPTYAVLNVADNNGMINVYGGEFYKQNPAAPGTEPKSWNDTHANGFVAEGYYSTLVGDYYIVSDSYIVATADDLQAALDNKIEDIRFAKDIVGDVTIDQQEGVNYVIDGADYKFDGTMYINGHNRHNGEETLTIKNVAFETAATKKDFIWNADSQSGTVRYAHNVTFDGCSFTAAEGTDVVGMRINQAFDIVVKNCVMNGGHSLAQITASSNTVIENCTINAGRGLNFLTSCVGLVVANCNITATKDDGYGIRCDAGVSSCLNLLGSTISAYEPIVLRSAKATFVFDVAATTLNATGDYQVVVNGEKPVMNGAEAYTCNM